MLVDGKVTTLIPITDRSVQYGDGSFTTIRVSNGKSELLNSHLARLDLANQRLDIDFTDWSLLQSFITDTAKNIGHGIIKVILSRGSGGRGYGTKGTGPASFIITTHDIPTHYDTWRQTGISMGLSSIKLAKQPLLAGLKHLNRLEQVLIRREVEQSTFSELLVCDYEDFIVEASMANVFWFKNDQWFTPQLDVAGVDGVMRNHIIKTLKEHGVGVSSVKAKPSALEEANELFICNSVMGIVSINNLYMESIDTELLFETKHSQALRHMISTGNE